MRGLALFTTTLVSLQLAQAGYQPFVDTFQPLLDGLPVALLKRQSTCPTGHTACTALSAPGSCCPNDTQCARDQNGNVACCPTNAVCTGVISGTGPRAAASSTTPFVLGASTSQSSSPTTQSAALQSGYSTLNGALYPFLVIPTLYPNSQQCLNAYTSCQSASTACFNALLGSNGVTISGIGTQGLTQAGVTATVPAQSASSICSSLSAQGCYNLQSTQCTSFGSAGVTQTTGFVQANAAQAVFARCTGAAYTAAMAVAAGAGVAGLMVQ